MKQVKSLVLGAEVFIYDGDRRIYRDREGHKTLAPQEWGKWEKHLIVEFTSRSAVTNKDVKISLNRTEDATLCFSWDRVERMISARLNSRKLADHIEQMVRANPDSYEEFRRIAGYREGED